MKESILTIGHSTLAYSAFLQLLHGAGITAVADVRSSPYSRRSSHFNRDALEQQLRTDGIAYVFLGEELGGRPKGKRFYCEGIADYEKMAATPSFNAAIVRLIEGTKRHRIALMCSEHNPLDCHRCLLVGRALCEREVDVRHIMMDGEQRTQLSIERELLAIAGKDNDDLFASAEERLDTAYKKRARQIAFALPETA
jgi:uncharacterized protein (DUF488 family)